MDGEGGITLAPSILDRAGASRAMLTPMQIFVGVEGGAADARAAAIEDGADPADRNDYLDEPRVESFRGPLEDAVSPYLVVQVQDREEFGSVATASIDGLLGIVYALLGLAVVISILGIVNTLALSIIERRQEIGMLRAVGMQRADIRRMVRLISPISISARSSARSCQPGLGFADGACRQGVGTIVVPWTLIGTMLLGAAIVGILAAAWPARRAAQTLRWRRSRTSSPRYGGRLPETGAVPPVRAHNGVVAVATAPFSTSTRGHGPGIESQCPPPKAPSPPPIRHVGRGARRGAPAPGRLSGWRAGRWPRTSCAWR